MSTKALETLETQERDDGPEAVFPAFTDLRWPLALLLSAFPARFLDEEFALWINPNATHALDSLGVWMDQWSTRVILLVMFTTALLAFTIRRLRAWRIPAGAFAVGWVATEIVVGVLKRAVGRPRPLHPEGLHEAIRPLYDKFDTKSFPSGHSATAFAFAVVAAFWWRKPAAVASTFLFASGIALSRCYVGAHYLSDILAGSAIGWAMATLAIKATSLERGRVGELTIFRKLWPLSVTAWVVVATWLLPSRVRLVDANSRTAVDDFEIVRNGVLFEPFTGPGYKIASLPDLKVWGLTAMVWGIVAAIALAVTLRKRSLPWIAAVGLFASLQGFVALGGGAPVRIDSVSSEGGGWALCDAQAHVGDPTDGAVELDPGLDRYRESGYDLVVLTHHNRWQQAREWRDDAWHEVDGLWGMEWSDGDHMATPLHLLVYNTKPLPADLGGRREDPEAMIARVHAAGGVVIASHFWRGKDLPPPAELVAWGVDGFEVAGRSQEFREDPLRRQAAIREIVSAENLAAFANGDYHGKRAWNAQWNAISRQNSESAAVAFLRGARGDRPVRCLVVESEPLPPVMPEWTRPAFTAVQYFRELSLKGRASWLFWLFVAGGAWVIAGRGKPRSGDQ